MNLWGDRLRDWSRNQPQLIGPSDSQLTLNWYEFDSTTSDVQLGLNKAGLLAGDLVILAMPRSTRAAVAILSCLRSDICGLVVERNSIRNRLNLCRQSVGANAIIFAESDAHLVNEALSTAQEADQYSEFSLPLGLCGLVRKKRSPSQIAAKTGWLLQTSGSTRFPLTVMLDKDDLATRAKGEARDFNIEPRSSLLNLLSFSHDLGFNQLLCSVVTGSTLAIHTDPFSLRLVELFSTHFFTGVVGTPVIWTELLKLPQRPAHQPYFLTISGGSLCYSQLQRLSALFPDSVKIKTYGQTETFRSLLCRNLDNESLGSAIAGVNLRLINPQNADCQPGEIGELVHYGDGRMLGYLGNEQASKQKHFDGGIRTGDLFKCDVNGQYFFCGRMDDMVKRWDQRLYLNEIESCVLELRSVDHAIAISRPAPTGDPRQNLVCLFVVPSPNYQLERLSLLRRCKERLEPFKVPDEVLVLPPPPPYTVSGKIDRHALLSLWEKGI